MANGEYAAPSSAGVYLARLTPMREQKEGALAIVQVDGEPPWLGIGAVMEVGTGIVYEAGSLSFRDIDVWGPAVEMPADL